MAVIKKIKSSKTTFTSLQAIPLISRSFMLSASHTVNAVSVHGINE